MGGVSLDPMGSLIAKSLVHLTISILKFQLSCCDAFHPAHYFLDQIASLKALKTLTSGTAATKRARSTKTNKINCKGRKFFRFYYLLVE